MINLSHALATQIVTRFQTLGLKLSTCESCTGGLVAAAITSVAGSSAIFDGGLITYANRIKEDWAFVLSETLTRYGAVSEPVAAEMALGVLKASHADIAISLTGIAGPNGGTAEKPVGTVCFGLARKDAQDVVHVMAQTQFFLNRDRQDVRQEAVNYGLRWVLETID